MLTVTTAPEGKSLNVTIPQSWNELTPHQATQCALLLRTHMRKAEQQLRLLLVLLNIRWYHVRAYLILFFRINPEQRYNLASEGTAFLYGENTLTNNPFPKLATRNSQLIGPANNLDFITGREFATAEKHLQEYHTTGSISELHKLAAALWRPKNTPLTEKEYLARAQKKHIPLSTLYAILQFYQCARNPFIEILNQHFPATDTASNKSVTGWLKTFYALAENINEVDGVADQTLDRIIAYLIHLKEDADALKKPRPHND